MIGEETKSIHKGCWGDLGYCLGDGVQVGASGNHHPTFPQQPLPTPLSPPASDLTPNSTHILVPLGDLPGDILLASTLWTM